MGGVTGAQYWKSALALVNGLVFSLAAGMLISAISRDSHKALTGTLFALLVLAAGGPLADSIIAAAKGRGFAPVWSLSSPGYVLVTASYWGRSKYWDALGITHLIAWVMFILACVLAPRTWQSTKGAGSSASRGWSYAWKYGGTRRRQRLRRNLLDRQPIAWLVCRERWQAQGVWVMVGLAAAGFAAALIWKPPLAAWFAWKYFGGLFALILYVWAASQACRFLVEARRGGLLELLLATPVNEKQIVSGQWRALRRMLGLPVLLLLVALVTGATLSQIAYHRITALTRTVATTPAATGTNQPGTNQHGGFSYNTSVTLGSSVTVNQQATLTKGPTTVTLNSGTKPGSAPTGATASSLAWQAGIAATAAIAAALSMIGNLLALGWFGMWMGLTSRSANLATLKTILFVQVIPWFVIAFGTSMVMGIFLSALLFRSSPAQSFTWLVWYQLLGEVLAAGLALIKDVAFIVWSRKKLLSSFRLAAAQTPGQPRLAPPPPPQPIASPPVVAALS
jgi:hypothetical protein